MVFFSKAQHVEREKKNKKTENQMDNPNWPSNKGNNNNWKTGSELVVS